VLLSRHRQRLAQASTNIVEASEVELTLRQMVMRMGYRKYR
jgi:hypothetical protein